MKEGRSAKYGRCLSSWVDFTIQCMPEEQRADYRNVFLKELKNYSLAGRKNGYPANQGCTYELSCIETADIKNPEHLAKLIKEGINLMYQKRTARNVLESLISNLQD